MLLNFDFETKSERIAVFSTISPWTFQKGPSKFDFMDFSKINFQKTPHRKFY